MKRKNPIRKRITFHDGRQTIKALISLVVVVLIFSLSSHVIEEDSVLDYIEIKTFLAIVLFFFIDTVINALSLWVLRLTEDQKKLISDYDYLIQEIYPKAPFFKYRETTFPVVVEVATDSRRLKIGQDITKIHDIPFEIKERYERQLEAHAFSTIRNRLLIRLDGIEKTEEDVILLCSRTTEYDVLATNRAMDYDRGGLSVRDLFEYGPFLTPLNESGLANHLGYVMMCETRDGYYVLTQKKKTNQTYKGWFGPTTTNILESKRILDDSGFIDIQGIYDDLSFGLDRIIRSNFKQKMEQLPKDILKTRLSVDPKDIKYIVRDIIEGGIPRLIVHTVVPINVQALIEPRNTCVFKGTGRKVMLVQKNGITRIEKDCVYIGSKKVPIDPVAAYAIALIESLASHGKDG